MNYTLPTLFRNANNLCTMKQAIKLEFISKCIYYNINICKIKFRSQRNFYIGSGPIKSLLSESQIHIVIYNIESSYKNIVIYEFSTK